MPKLTPAPAPEPGLNGSAAGAVRRVNHPSLHAPVPRSRCDNPPPAPDVPAAGGADTTGTEGDRLMWACPVVQQPRATTRVVARGEHVQDR